MLIKLCSICDSIIDQCLAGPSLQIENYRILHADDLNAHAAKFKTKIRTRSLVNGGSQGAEGVGQAVWSMSGAPR